jgi:hypothetical protein
MCNDARWAPCGRHVAMQVPCRYRQHSPRQLQLACLCHGLLWNALVVQELCAPDTQPVNRRLPRCRGDYATCVGVCGSVPNIHARPRVRACVRLPSLLRGTHARTRTCMHTHMHMHMRVHTPAHAHDRTCMHPHIRTHAHAHTHTHTRTRSDGER